MCATAGEPDGAVRAVPRASTAAPQVSGLRRPQLLRALDTVARDRMGLVVAPPGTGKTTLMAQWAAASGLPVAWCRLDAGATRRLVPLLHRALAPHLPRDDAPESPEQLALTLERLTGPVLLVLDDLHVLAGQPAEAELEQVLLLAPPQLRVLIGSRRMPGFNLARSELAALVVLTGEDLRFRTWEVETLFRQVHRAPLPPHDTAALTRYTQGWAAALQLFHLSTIGSQPADRHRAVHALAGRARYAQDYLTAQVLAGLPPETTAFLVRTCVFDALTADRCNALLGTTDAQRTLRDLVTRQALTTTTDGGETFSYHEVLRRHLETALREELGPAGTAEWYVRAAAILEEEGDLVEALRARARAEDWPGVRALLHESGERVFASPHQARSRDQTWAGLLPAWLTASDPWCCLADARRLLGDGRLDDAAAAAERARTQFTDAIAQKLCDELRADITAWRGGPVPPRPRWPDLLLAATHRHPLDVARRAAAAEDPAVRAVAGFAHLLGGDRRAGSRELRTLAEQPEGTAPGLALAARLVLATLGTIVSGGVGRRTEVRAGPLSSPQSSPFDQIYLDAEHHGLTWLARLTSAIAVAGHGGDRRPMAAVIGDLDARGDRWAAAIVALVWCFIRLPSGTVDSRTLDQLRRRLRELDAGVLEAWVSAIGALLAAAQQLPDAAELARQAEAHSRSAGVPGASAIAYAALAAARAEDREELLTLARTTASTTGLDCRPWAWLPDMSPWSHEPAGPRPTAPSPDTPAPPTPPSAATPPADPSTSGPSAASPPEPGSRPAPVLTVRCFGELQLLVDGRVPDLSGIRPRARTVLRFLAVHAGRPVHRELIADALWGELDPAAAMHNLQVSVSSLRAALEPGVPGRHSRIVVRDGESYMLALGPGSTSDVVEVDEALSAAARAARRGDVTGQRAALNAVLAVYAGDVLPEEGPADWLVPTRERYRTRVAEAAALLAELALTAGDHAEAVRAAQRSVDIDEYRDDAWRTLVAALRAAGEPAAAERAARSYSQVLRELGVAEDP
ncbi:BTAD domain-containing putative transcriptional regulator [Oceanitalea stevensii]|uniref:Winged helix-turn-helix domain-containing protein n=1 Tax=Oceanitalea stevensii TaxID=2763072 RepID=A0ABR8Z5D0_9MICO|nr:BTAD domain-containing putative transcriptional regulator [Oceanitalea stevensii]MBD8063474.1 winged helix-turn-helix domain-containing protein [Oceanitalea stevensii]